MPYCDKCRTEIHKKTGEKIWYGEFVKMSEKEYNKLLAKYGKIQTEKLIEKLENYIGTKKKDPYPRSHYRAILSWVVESCKVYEIRKEEKVKETAPEAEPASQEAIDKEIKKVKEVLSKVHKGGRTGNTQSLGQILSINVRDEIEETNHNFEELKKIEEYLKKHYAGGIGRSKIK